MTEAVILAGGLGTRLRDVVPDLPKPMAPVNGRPFLSHQLDYWIGQGVRRFVLSVGYKSEIIMVHFGKQYGDAVIDYAVEETPIGTGGGLLLAMETLQPKRPFLVLNGDTFFTVPLQTLQNYHAAQRSDWTLALFQADTSDRYGKVDCALDGGVLGFPAAKAKIGEPASGGVYLISPDALARLPQPENNAFSLEQQLLPAFLAQGGRCYGLPCPEQFIDIGLPADYDRALSVMVNE